MNNFLKRIEKLEKILPKQKFYWVFSDGSKQAVNSTNDPIKIIIGVSKFDLKPCTWLYDGTHEDIDPITKSIFDEALKDNTQYQEQPQTDNKTEFQKILDKPVTQDNRKEYLCNKINEVEKSSPNGLSDNKHCI